VPKDALIQTYRQFAHLQQRHLEAKPIFDFLQRVGLTASDLPALERLIQRAVSTVSTPAQHEGQSQAVQDLTQSKWYQELHEFYPETASWLLAQAKAIDAKVAEVEGLKRLLTQFTGALSTRQQQAQAVSVLQHLAERVRSLATTYPDLQDQAHAASFLQYLYTKNPLVEQLADDEFLEALYLRFNRDGIAKRLAAQAESSRAGHAATLAAGFAEGGGVRSGAQKSLSPIEEEIRDLITD